MSCRIPIPYLRRIEEAVARPLIEKFSRDESLNTGTGSDHHTESASDGSERTVAGDVVVDSRPGDVVVHLGTESSELDRDQVRQLREALGDALTDSNEFVHTVGHHREDGSYVVERRGADSAGHRKVFDSFVACRDLFVEMPREFTAADVERAGLSGGRRHMLVWHFVEHPAFDCELASRQPLTVTKPTATPETPASEVVGD